ncbi:MAG: hypothetical protein ACJ8GN_09800 [Longimicrobiaceae bacterium]
MNTTTTETTSTATQVVVNRYQPKEPGLPIADGQTALLQRFGVRVKRGMTQGQASNALYRYFCSHLDEYVAYEAEKRQKRQEGWAAKVRENLALAVARSQQTNRVPANERQISAVMAAAFIRDDITDTQRIEARTLLQYGAGSAMASTFLNQLPARSQQQPTGQPN